jgi:hypothetical protein
MKIILCLICPILLLASGLYASPSWNITRVGGVTTDWFNNVKTVGDIAYCSTNFGLVLMDVSDKENPVIFDRIETNGSGRSIEIRDTTLFFCDGYAGLKIFSIVEPTEPVLIGVCEEPAGAGRIVLRDEYAFISRGRAGMSIVDISDPFQPEEIGRTNRDCDGIALIDNYAYLGSGYIGIVNIEDPTNPELLAWSEYPYNGEMSIYGEILCGRLIFFNLENRLEPEQILRHPTYGGTSHEIVDNFIFLPKASREFHGLNVTCYSIENIREPVLQFVHPVTFDATDLDYSDEYIYLTGGSEGLSISDVRDWDNTQEVGTFVNSAYYRNVAVGGDYAYANDEFGRFVVISLENPNQPVEVFEKVWYEFDLHTPEMPLVVTDDYIYSYHYFVSVDENGEENDHRGLYTYSIQNPAAPELIHELPINSDHQCYDLKIDGDFLYGSSIGIGLIVFSLANPAAPELINVYEEYRQNHKFDIEGDLIVTATEFAAREKGIVIWDISDPFNVQVISEFIAGATMHDLAIVDDYVYLIASGGEFWILSIADPVNPQIVDHFPLTYTGSDIEEKNGLLYIAEQQNGVEIFSLDDPENPELIGYYDTPGTSRNLTLRDSLLFVADKCDFGIYDVSAVQGMWYIDLSAESHIFDSTAVDSVSEWALTLSNLSENERAISELTFDDATFSCQVETPFTIPADSDTVLTLIFTPLADTLYSSTSTIISGEKERDVNLSGQGYLPNSVIEDDVVPLEFALGNAYPNPFNSTTTIAYNLSMSGEVRLSIHDLQGREITVLQNTMQTAGLKKAIWNADDQPSGLYFCRLESVGKVATTKLMLVK